MMARATLYRWEDLPLEIATEMVARKAMTVAGAEIVQLYFKKGAVVPQHQHAASLAVYVLQGTIRFVVEGTATTVREGEVLMIPAGAWHESESLDDTFVMTFAASIA
jgi:quercetin dioxygenase-like cupin family protein